MQTNAQKIRDFHLAVNGTAPILPVLPSAETLQLRQTLICEEYEEVSEALQQLLSGETADIAHLMHECADLLYVVYGTLDACGVDADAVFGEVHRANMQKASGPRRADGKILKPADFKPADVASIILSQAADALEK